MTRRKNKKHTKTFDPIRRSWIIIILVVIVFPIAWLIIDGTDWLTSTGIRNFINQEPSAWTSAFLGYFASALAATLGFVSVVMTIYQQEKSRREDKRKDVLPLIAVSKNNSTSKAKVPHVITNESIEKVNLNPSNGDLFSLKNVGMREMYNVAITDIVCNLLDDQIQKIQISPVIYQGSSVTIRLQPVIIGDFSEAQGIDPIKEDGQMIICINIPAIFTISISYQDCYNNQYKQKIKIETSIGANLFEDEESNTTYDSTTIEKIEILSAPELITEGNSKK